MVINQAWLVNQNQLLVSWNSQDRHTSNTRSIPSTTSLQLYSTHKKKASLERNIILAPWPSKASKSHATRLGVALASLASTAGDGCMIWASAEASSAGKGTRLAWLVLVALGILLVLILHREDLCPLQPKLSLPLQAPLIPPHISILPETRTYEG